MKADDAAILAILNHFADAGLPIEEPSATPKPNTIARYQQRYTDAFPPKMLASLRIVIHQ